MSLAYVRPLCTLGRAENLASAENVPLHVLRSYNAIDYFALAACTRSWAHKLAIELEMV